MAKPYPRQQEARQRNRSQSAICVDKGAANPSAVEPLQHTVEELESRNEALLRAQGDLQLANVVLEQRVLERTALAQWRADQLRVLTIELAQAEQRERRRLAQLLHDDLQQSLVAAQFKLAAIQRESRDPALQAELQQARDLVNESIDASRTLTCELSPPALHEGGLCAALQSLAQHNEGKHGLNTTIRADRRNEPTNEGLKLLLFQVVRELLFNVIKHGNTDRAWVELSKPLDDRIQLVIWDEGDGFDLTGLENASRGGGRFGLFSVRERLQSVGGKLTIETSPGHGTRVTIVAPASL